MKASVETPARGGRQSPDWLETGIVKTDEVYKTVNGLPLRIHIFVSEKPVTRGPLPAIIFYHGGGWDGGEPDQFFVLARYFAFRGLVAFSVQYRLHQEADETTPAQAVTRAKSAYRWVRANAGRLGVEPRRIVVSGSSAGGHLAAAVAVLPGFDDPGDDLSIPCDPAAMVLFNPVTDTTPRGYHSKKFAQGDPPIDAVSVCDPKFITARTPPTLICHPVQDKSVAFENSQRFAALMTAAGARCQLIGVEDTYHGYIYAGPWNEKAVESTRDMDHFLRDLGCLTGEPSITFVGT